MNKKQLTERLTILVVDEAKWSRLEDYLEATELITERKWYPTPGEIVEEMLANPTTWVIFL